MNARQFGQCMSSSLGAMVTARKTDTEERRWKRPRRRRTVACFISLLLRCLLYVSYGNGTSMVHLGAVILTEKTRFRHSANDII